MPPGAARTGSRDGDECVIAHACDDPRIEREFIRYLQADAVVFPDSRQVATHLVAEGDFAAFRLDMEVFRVNDGKLAELWVTWDNVAALVQLGHFGVVNATV
jgi:predicted ester cyclase